MQSPSSEKKNLWAAIQNDELESSSFGEKALEVLEDSDLNMPPKHPDKKIQ